MARNPVFCHSPIMVLAAMISNINCDIGKHRMSSTTDHTGRGGGASGPRAVVSLPLHRMKHDMLWIFHDRGALTTVAPPPSTRSSSSRALLGIDDDDVALGWHRVLTLEGARRRRLQAWTFTAVVEQGSNTSASWIRSTIRLTHERSRNNGTMDGMLW